jgi:hypothetical protein
LSLLAAAAAPQGRKTSRRHPENKSAWAKKKADVVEHPEVSDHIGLLVNKPPGPAGLPFS